MKTYVLTLLFVSALCGGCIYLCEGRKYEKHVRYLSTLLMLTVLVAPLPKIINEKLSLPDLLRSSEIESGDAAYIEALQAESEKKLSEDLTALLKKKCSLDDRDLSLHATLVCRDKQFDLRSIEVRLLTLTAVYRRENLREILMEYCETIVFTEEL